MKEFKINDFISLRFRYPHTEIYMNGKYFMECKRLLLSIPKSDLNQYKNIESIDEAAEVYDHFIYEHQILKDDGIPEVENDENFSLIEPEEEFWGHCSNLQVWAEHDYDTRLLKANLAFPLLEQLAKGGDKRAEVRFKEEILKRLLSGSKSVVEYLFVEGYQDYLDNEELLFGLLDSEEAETLINLQKELEITFKYVPCINRGLDVAWKERKIIRKFSMSNRRVSGIDLSNCNLYELPDDIFKITNVKVIHIGRNPDFNMTLNYFKDVTNKLKNLKIIIFDQNQMENFNSEIEKLFKKRNIKAISSHSSDFITLDSNFD